MTETNPTPSAEERERIEKAMGEAVRKSRDIEADWPEACGLLAEVAIKEIRQAEQAARADERRKTLEECKQVAARLGSVVLLQEINALTNESGEPGEAA